MADSERSEDRDSEVPDPSARDIEGKAGPERADADTPDPEEPHHGVPSWLTWIKPSIEAITAIAGLVALIHGLVNGNGG
ncbi:hypothetical protein ACWCWD_04350 [Streptomyces sp. NPDC001493]